MILESDYDLCVLCSESLAACSGLREQLTDMTPQGTCCHRHHEIFSLATGLHYILFTEMKKRLIFKERGGGKDFGTTLIVCVCVCVCVCIFIYKNRLEPLVNETVSLGSLLTHDS